jgi:hypothetical protein
VLFYRLWFLHWSRDPFVNGWSGNRLDIDYFNLNLTISDNGNGKEYKESL